MIWNLTHKHTFLNGFTHLTIQEKNFMFFDYHAHTDESIDKNTGKRKVDPQWNVKCIKCNQDDAKNDF